MGDYFTRATAVRETRSSTIGCVLGVPYLVGWTIGLYNIINGNTYHKEITQRDF
jgi:hypothetical protein